MRTSLFLCWASLVLLAGCTIVSKDSEQQEGEGGSAGNPEGGGAGEAGAAGAAGTAGVAGSAGSITGPCGDVPTTGRCVDDHTLEMCVVSDADDQPPKVVSGACKTGMICKTDADGASCQIEGTCVEGASECADKYSYRTCTQGAWVLTSCDTGLCQASPGYGATCMSNAGGESHPITGKLHFEHPTVKEDLTGYDYDNQVIDPAYSVVVVAYDGDEYIGSAYTRDPDGEFQIDATKAPTANTWLWFFPMVFDDNGVPMLAVARPSTYQYSNLESQEYWNWAAPTNGNSDIGTVVVREVDGSGALYIYELLVYGLNQALYYAPSIKPFNVLALWEPGKRFDCANGTCYVPKGWGAAVKYDGGQDLYAGAVLLAGTDDSPHQWSASVILHEFGHYIMDSYSRSPREAGKHSGSMLEKPGMAWSEGWATFYGQMMLGKPIYFDKQEGTTWWYDVRTPKSYVPKPDPNGPIDQQLGEMMVTAMAWHLWDTESEAWDPSTIADETIWKAFTSTRMTQMNRGYEKVDFVDFLDSLRCEGVQQAPMDSVLQHFEFPYDHAMICP